MYKFLHLTLLASCGAYVAASPMPQAAPYANSTIVPAEITTSSTVIPNETPTSIAGTPSAVSNSTVVVIEQRKPQVTPAPYDTRQT